MFKITSSVKPTEINTGQKHSSGIGRWSTACTPHYSQNPRNTCCPQTSITSRHQQRRAGTGGIETLSSYLAEIWILQPTRLTGKNNLIFKKSEKLEFPKFFNPIFSITQESTLNLSIYTNLFLFFFFFFLQLHIFVTVIKMKNDLLWNSLFSLSNQLPKDIIKSCLSL